MYNTYERKFAIGFNSLDILEVDNFATETWDKETLSMLAEIDIDLKAAGKSCKRFKGRDG